MPEVPWATFVAYPDGDEKFSEAWLSSPVNVVSLFPDGSAYCRLCDSYFTGSPAEHVTEHETSLGTWREQHGRNGKASDSDIAEKLDKAVRLLDEGLSQRQAAATVGIPRSNLQRRLQRPRKRAGGWILGWPTLPSRGNPRSGPGPPDIGEVPLGSLARDRHL